MLNLFCPEDDPRLSQTVVCWGLPAKLDITLPTSALLPSPTADPPSDPQALFGIDLPLNVQIPTVAVKWITYVLVLHIVGLGFAAVATFFGLLAHVRELSMMTISSCSAGIGAFILLLAFVFDLVFFFIAKSRINAVGGSAEIGNGLWLTLASWVLLFFSGCFYGFGRCCISKRPRGQRSTKKDKNSNVEQGGVGYAAQGGIVPLSNAESMRMEAIKSENDRKARQAEQGLPAFPTQAEAVPLRKNSTPQYYYETDSEDEQTQRSYRDEYRPVTEGPRRQGTGYTARSARSQGSGDTNITTNYAGRGRAPTNPGYIPALPGRNPVDPYNNISNSASNVPPTFPPSPPLPNSYPPQTHYAQPSAGYSVSTSPPPMPVGGVTQQSQYLTPPGVGSGVGQVYGHGPQESSCECPASPTDLPGSDVIVRTDQSAYSHQPGYSSYDPYGSTNPYTASGVGRQQDESSYFNAQNTPSMPSRTPAPPVPQPQPQQAYNPFAQYTQNPAQHPVSEQAHVTAPWQQAPHAQRQPTMPIPTPTPAQPLQQNTSVPNEAPPGYDYGMPGGYR